MMNYVKQTGALNLQRLSIITTQDHLEEGRVANVGGACVPRVEGGGRCRQLVPVWIACCDLGVRLLFCGNFSKVDYD